MKFSPDHYKSLKESIAKLQIPLKKTQEIYIRDKVGKDPKVRFVWDIFWAS